MLLALVFVVSQFCAQRRDRGAINDYLGYPSLTVEKRATIGSARPVPTPPAPSCMRYQNARRTGAFQGANFRLAIGSRSTPWPLEGNVDASTCPPFGTLLEWP